MTLNLALQTPNEDSHAWHDLGALAELWGQTPCEPTCKAYNAEHPTRRDFVFANTDGLEFEENFEVRWKYLYAVHATISFTLNFEQLEKKGREVCGVFSRKAHGNGQKRVWVSARGRFQERAVGSLARTSWANARIHE